MLITVELLERWHACADGLASFRERYPNGVDSAAHLADLSVRQPIWRTWLASNLAQYGSAEDRLALRTDPASSVRLAVARYGSAEDRLALRNDPDANVRLAVARYGSAEDRLALRNDPDANVRLAVAQYGSAEDRLALRNDRAAGAHGDAFGSGTTK